MLTRSRNRSRVLSAPSVIASDNVAANIQVGSQIPGPDLAGGRPRGNGRRQSLFQHHQQPEHRGHSQRHPAHQRRGVGHLDRPDRKSAVRAPPPTAGIQSPSINIRSVDTQVTIKNGQTIALGGIISESNGISRNRIPLLGRIPGLGLLFGNTSTKKTRTELIALITPHVIEDIDQATDLTEELKSTLKGLKKELSRDKG